MNRRVAITILIVVAVLVAILLGSAFVCLDNIWILQCRSSGVLFDERIRYVRIDPLPDVLFRFDHWAGDVYFDEDLGFTARVACYSTADGLGCDIRYRPEA